MYHEGHSCLLQLTSAKNRENDACVFMEDVGTINNLTDNGKKKMKNEIINNMVSSVLEVGRNQEVRYEKIFIDIVDRDIKKDEIGCAWCRGIK